MQGICRNSSLLYFRLEAAAVVAGRLAEVFRAVAAEVGERGKVHLVGYLGERQAVVVCWATPIYYYEMSGQMKTLIDRMNAMDPKDYRFRDVYLLTTAAEDEAFVPRRAESGLHGWIDCYGKCSLKGHLFCGGGAPRDIAGHAKLREAYEMGYRLFG